MSMEQLLISLGFTQGLAAPAAAIWEIDYVEHVFGLILLGLIPAFIARKKGRNFFHWWLFGSVLFVVALPAALYIEPADGPAWWQ
jgi:hypothetical protein